MIFQAQRRIQLVRAFSSAAFRAGVFFFICFASATLSYLRPINYIMLFMQGHVAERVNLGAHIQPWQLRRSFGIGHYLKTEWRRGREYCQIPRDH